MPVTVARDLGKHFTQQFTLPTPSTFSGSAFRHLGDRSFIDVLDPFDLAGLCEGDQILLPVGPPALFFHQFGPPLALFDPVPFKLFGQLPRLIASKRALVYSGRLKGRVRGAVGPGLPPGQRPRPRI